MPIDLDAIIVEHVCRSKDGTRVPMFVIRRAGSSAPVPTILYGYGGYDTNMVPYYSPAALAWVEGGGAYAVANLRGESKYGKAWHDAGRLANKRNVFDDFIAAAEMSQERKHRRGRRACDPGRIQRRAAGRGRGQPAS